MSERKSEIVLPRMRYIDYKDVETLKRFVNAHGRISPRKHTKLQGKEQRALARAVKHARFMGLMPFVAK